jgi:hypothetical protein
MMWMIATAYAMPALSFVSLEGVNYADVRSDVEFQQWLTTLPTSDIPTQSTNAQKAFWINVYNGLTIQTVAENMPINSIRELNDGQVWTTRTFIVGGQTMTLDKIEKDILGQFKDPRIHAALNCASKGCPPLFERPFTESKLDAQLDLVSQRWVQNGGFIYEDGWFGNTASLSTIFDWYKGDFPCDAAKPIPKSVPKEYCGALQFIAHHSPEYRSQIESTAYEIKFQPYDWSLNIVQ